MLDDDDDASEVELSSLAAVAMQMPAAVKQRRRAGMAAVAVERRISRRRRHTRGEAPLQEAGEGQATREGANAGVGVHLVIADGGNRLAMMVRVRQAVLAAGLAEQGGVGSCWQNSIT